MDEMPFDKLHEECGVFGIYRADPSDRHVVADTYHALYALQHRGQESCGMVVNDDGVMAIHKDNGLVAEVFTQDVLNKMPEGTMAVGHCRYGTMGGRIRANAQPLLINHQKGAMALAHNGNLTNAYELREKLEQNGAIFHCTSDTEVIAYIITQERLKCGSVEEAVLNAMQVIKGAYSLVIMSPTKLIACRDPHGFRPLCMGKIGNDVVFASESCALDAIGATFVRDIEAGEVVVVNQEGIRSYKTPGACHDGMCVFEFIYFARPDSVIDGSSVHQARLRAGSFLALDHPVQADVVIGVPDSGLDAAMGYSRTSGIPYGIGFIKNKYIGRTFIQPGQKARQDAVRIKLNVISATVKDKRVVMVDDSIVRGTTSAGMPEPRKCTCGFPRPPLPTPASSARMWTARTSSLLPITPSRKWARSSGRIPSATCPWKPATSWRRTVTAASARAASADSIPWIPPSMQPRTSSISPSTGKILLKKCKGAPP